MPKRAQIVAVALSAVIAGCGSASTDRSPTIKAPSSTGASATTDPTSTLLTVVVSPVQAGGPNGTTCHGAGSLASIEYGYQVNYTAISGTRHCSFLGDAESSLEVRHDRSADTCTFALLFLPAADGPFRISIATNSSTS